MKKTQDFAKGEGLDGKKFYSYLNFSSNLTLLENSRDCTCAQKICNDFEFLINFLFSLNMYGGFILLYAGLE